MYLKSRLENFNAVVPNLNQIRNHRVKISNFTGKKTKSFCSVFFPLKYTLLGMRDAMEGGRAQQCLEC